MPSPSTHDLTGLLHAWRAGDNSALQRLVPLVHRELRRAARYYMAGEQKGHVLQTTALVNEVYLRLMGVQKVNWQNRAHFVAICAQLMRRVLTDEARKRGYQKRGGGLTRVGLSDVELPTPPPNMDFAALDEAIVKLAKLDERKSKVVELRFFGGLDVRETAEVLGVSSDTVMRDWKFAKAWLLRTISEGAGDES